MEILFKREEWEIISKSMEGGAPVKLPAIFKKLEHEDSPPVKPPRVHEPGLPDPQTGQALLRLHQFPIKFSKTDRYIS
ncbi:unnamed protein product, partial [Dovyalis caffra]